MKIQNILENTEYPRKYWISVKIQNIRENTEHPWKYRISVKVQNIRENTVHLRKYLIYEISEEILNIKENTSYLKLHIKEMVVQMWQKYKQSMLAVQFFFSAWQDLYRGRLGVRRVGQTCCENTHLDLFVCNLFVLDV